MNILISNRFEKLTFLCLTLLTLTGCGVKNIGTAADFDQLGQRLQEGELRIEVNAAFPFNTAATQQVLNSILIRNGDNAGRIDLSGDGNFIQLGEDRVVANLPYFGERRQGGGYGNSNEDAGIYFDLAPENYMVKKQESERQYSITYDANKSGVDSFNVDITLFTNGNATIYVNSNTRTRIEYHGRVVDVQEE